MLKKENYLDQCSNFQLRYDKLCSKYSLGYLSGCNWYVGKCIIKYMNSRPYCGLFDKKLIFLYNILYKKDINCVKNKVKKI